jgi:signal transduction histidine kinase
VAARSVQPDPELESSTGFSRFIGEAIRSRKHLLARRWVESLARRLGAEDEKAVLPSDQLLNHIPSILDRVADFVADSDAALLEALVIDDLSRLAELRISQGYGLGELIAEHQIFSEIIQDAVEEAIEDFAGEATLGEAVRTIGRLKDSVHLLGTVSARSVSGWVGRWERERRTLLETYGQVVAHELGNRLGAAETGVQLLRSSSQLSEERRDHLLQLILESVRGGMKTIRDVDVLSRPLTEETASAAIGLPLLVSESVRLVDSQANGRDITVRVRGSTPDARVPGPPVRIALSNLLTNAVKHHRQEGDGRWIEVRVAEDGQDILLSVEDNGPGIPEDIREDIFRYSFRANSREEGSGLGLAITRDCLSRVGGSIDVAESPSGGALFQVRVRRSADGAPEEGDAGAVRTEP